MQALRHAAGKLIDTYHLVLFFNKVIMLYLGFLEILTIILITKGATDFLTLTFILNAPVGWILCSIFFLGVWSSAIKLDYLFVWIMQPEKVCIFLYSVVTVF